MLFVEGEKIHYYGCMFLPSHKLVTDVCLSPLTAGETHQLCEREEIYTGNRLYFLVKERALEYISHTCFHLENVAIPVS